MIFEFFAYFWSQSWEVVCKPVYNASVLFIGAQNLRLVLWMFIVGIYELKFEQKCCKIWLRVGILTHFGLNISINKEKFVHFTFEYNNNDLAIA